VRAETRSRRQRRAKGEAIVVSFEGKTDWDKKFVPNPKCIPPADADAERAVLSACLNAQSCLDECLDLIRKEHFYVPAHQEIWEAMLFVHLEGSPVDVVTVKNRLATTGRLAIAEGSKYLGEVIDATPAVANVRTHAQRVLDLARLRRGIAMCQTLASEGYQSSAEVEAFLQKLEAEAIALNQVDKADEGQWMRTLVPEAYRLAESVEAGETPPGLATGFADYDDLTGGFHDGDLVIIAARPGMGKTSFMLGIARNMADLGAVAIYSAEMPKEQLTQRLIVSEAGVDLSKLRRGKGLNDTDWTNIAIASDRLAKIPIYIDDAVGLSVLGIRSRATRLKSQLAKQGQQLVAVFIDYLQMLGNEDEKANREQQVARSSRDSKQMAKALKIPVVMLASLNRDVEKRPNKRPILSDLRESGQIESDADVVTFLYRPWYYEEKEKDQTSNAPRPEPLDEEGQQEQRRTELIIDKQRNGPTGSVHVEFWSASATFTSWKKREQPQENYGRREE
jgi:replicative DNA helicase